LTGRQINLVDGETAERADRDAGQPDLFLKTGRQINFYRQAERLVSIDRQTN
jgi:hypothetical protein